MGAENISKINSFRIIGQGKLIMLCPINSVKGGLGLIKICALKLRNDWKKLEKIQWEFGKEGWNMDK